MAKAKRGLVRRERAVFEAVRAGAAARTGDYVDGSITVVLRPTGLSDCRDADARGLAS